MSLTFEKAIHKAMFHALRYIKDHYLLESKTKLVPVTQENWTPAENLENEMAKAALKHISTGDITDGYHSYDELYEHRHMLFMLLMKANPMFSYKAKKHDDGSDMEGWFYAWIGSGKQQIGYHLPIAYWITCPGVEMEKGPPYDGHTSWDVVRRIKEFYL